MRCACYAPTCRRADAMERFDGTASLPRAYRDGVVALGNFDGFHLGHQAVVGRAVERARAEGRPALVGTFDPHPARFFTPALEPIALTTMEQRLTLMAAAGVDAAVVWRFDAALAVVSAADFMVDALAGMIGAAHVVTGWDFTFGAKRGGGAAMLAELGPGMGYTAEALGAVMLDGAPVSSTRVREALRDGRPDAAARLLGRPFTVAGPIEHGAKLGRTLGFPTANMRLGDYVRPAYGVYAVRVVLPDGERRDGVANLGVRPMFEPPIELLETYLFDFEGDLYGREVEVELVAYLRPEWKLDGLDALVRQVAADKAAAQAVLAAG